MNKRPSFQFYPGDWVRDNIAGCSLAAQGLWLRLMIVMHDSERYGYLSTNGKAISDEALARKCGATLPEYHALMKELDDAGIPSRTEHGIIYSRRMVRDERERAQGRDYTRRTRAKCKGDVRPMSDASSSSPSSSSSEKKNPPKAPRSFAPPTLTMVKVFMKNDKWAEDFHDYFQSNGWKVGGRAPMKDWEAAARRWMRTEKDRPARPGAPPMRQQGPETFKCFVCQKQVLEKDKRSHMDAHDAQHERAEMPAETRQFLDQFLGRSPKTKEVPHEDRR